MSAQEANHLFILLSGCPGIGKSTFANGLLEKKGKDNYVLVEENEAYDKLIKCKGADKKNIIYTKNFGKKKMKACKSQVEKAGYKFINIHLSTSDKPEHIDLWPKILDKRMRLREADHERSPFHIALNEAIKFPCGSLPHVTRWFQGPNNKNASLELPSSSNIQLTIDQLVSAQGAAGFTISGCDPISAVDYPHMTIGLMDGVSAKTCGEICDDKKNMIEISGNDKVFDAHLVYFVNGTILTITDEMRQQLIGKPFKEWSILLKDESIHVHEPSINFRTEFLTKQVIQTYKELLSYAIDKLALENLYKNIMQTLQLKHAQALAPKFGKKGVSMGYFAYVPKDIENYVALGNIIEKVADKHLSNFDMIKVPHLTTYDQGLSQVMHICKQNTKPKQLDESIDVFVEPSMRFEQIYKQIEQII